METPVTNTVAENDFLALLEQRPLPVTDLLSQIHACEPVNKPKAEEWTLILVDELTDQADFPGLYLAIKDRAAQLVTALSPADLRDLLKKACKDRLVTALIESVGFGEMPLAESFRRLDRLLALKPGTLVLDPAWGVGTVKRLDDFYRRVTVDFDGKPNHAMTFAAASETLDRAPHNHLLTQRHNDPQAVARMAAEQPGELVRCALRSFGDMPVARIEETLTRQGFVAAAKWKSFWEAARKALKNDPLVVIPTKRSEPVRLLAEPESYGDAWFTRFAALTSPSQILNDVLELEAANPFAGLEEAKRGVLEERLAFAVKGAHNTDAALYARLATAISRFGFLTPSAEQMRAHLWENDRYIEAAEHLGVRDVSALVIFLLAGGGDAAERLLGSLDRMPFTLLSDVLAALRDNPQTAAACRKLLSQPKAPPALINWVFRYRDQTAAWDLPPLGELLNHAIALVEGRLSGEALRMQNSLKALFEQSKWLETIFTELDTPQRQLFFERVQASQAWDPSTHRSLLGRMLKLDPSLADRKRAAAPQPQTAARVTSWRSLNERQLLYKRLVEVELPKNSHDIATARSYGDLRENFEYQAAKDYQRQLLQRQDEMQQELKLVKGTDFADAPCDKVGPGTTVVLRMADGSRRTYTVLGEWDRDERLNIISNRTRLAQNLEGKAVGDTVAVPSPAGDETACIDAIRPLDETIRAWINSTPEVPA
ncbi:MAG TPA: GreA/GreB family elongation factor [Kiritimatiellia bacterium]|nr:GreA/GreB family elongation factor [Kiritimatiellia bacterium]HRU71651.1 GreA/GreB family elongation factor [Kiritimatiellia bacterium]